MNYCCLVILLSSIKNMKSQCRNLYSLVLTSSRKVLTCLHMVTLKKPTYVVTVTDHSVLFLVFNLKFQSTLHITGPLKTFSKTWDF